MNDIRCRLSTLYHSFLNFLILMKGKNYMERCELYKASNGDYAYYLIIETEPIMVMVRCSQEQNLREYPLSIPIPLSNGKILWAETYDDDLKGDSKKLLL